MNKLISIVIPAYNEAKIMGYTINQICSFCAGIKLNYELIIIENGSKDKTAEIATALAHKNNKIKVFSQTLGNYGLALRRGMEEAKGEIIVNFDADFYDLNFLLEAIELLNSPNGYELVIASKHLRSSKDQRSIIRKTISKCFNVILWLVVGLKVSDTHGIKAWKNSDLLKRMMRKTKGVSNVYDTELILRMQRYGARIKEVPIEVKELRKARSGIIKRAWGTFFEVGHLFRNVYW